MSAWLENQRQIGEANARRVGRQRELIVELKAGCNAQREAEIVKELRLIGTNSVDDLLQAIAERRSEGAKPAGRRK